VSPCSTSSRRRAPAPFRVPLPSVRGLSPSSRVLPETAAELHMGRVAHPLGPSHGVLLPAAVANAKGPLFPGCPTSPARCVFRVRALLTPCSPSRLPPISGQAALGIATFRALTPPDDPEALSSPRAFLAVA
jgi:hypothetical protein